jgi:hypothetical protein
MPKYGIQFANQTTSTANKSVLGCYMVTSLTMDAEIVEVIITGSGSVAAADIQTRAQLVPFTFGATGASTSITPIPFNPRAGAALGNYGTNYSTEPTTSSAVVPVQFGFNQRGGMRYAVPQGEGYKINSNGITHYGATVQTLASAAGNVDANLHFWQGN